MSVPIAARLRRGTTPASCVTSTGMPAQNAATILKPLVFNPHSIPFTHVADWIAPFPSSSSQTPPYYPFSSYLSFPPLRAQE